MSLKTVLHANGSHALVSFSGTLDQESARVVRLKAQSLLAKGCRYVTFDLSGIESLDSAGRDVLRYVDRIFTIAGGASSIRGCTLELEAQMLGLDAIDLLHPTRSIGCSVR